MIAQLNPTLPVDTPKGKGLAFLVLDYGEEHFLYFTVAIDASREIWTFPNTKIHVQENITFGRTSEPQHIVA